ncbi:RagB/SusD family nutrient uptake outer membrane protein, partial [Lacticaseibacillus rhamnosus]
MGDPRGALRRAHRRLPARGDGAVCGRRYGAYGGWWASNGPSQNLVDDYDMATTGEPPFKWTGGGPGSMTAATQQANPASGYDPKHPYWDRDPRFQATVLYDSS